MKDRTIRESVKLDVKHVYREQEKIIQRLIQRETANGGQPLAGAASDGASAHDGDENHDSGTSTFLDIGVLRFPDFQQPYVQVRILNANLVNEVSQKLNAGVPCSANRLD